VLRRGLAVVACALALAACQVDIDVDVMIEPDGTGTITVVAIADAEVVAAVPTIADEIVLDDVVAAGWIIDGPVATDDGGLSVTMTHDCYSRGQCASATPSSLPKHPR
jgi:hypothetical protein